VQARLEVQNRPVRLIGVLLAAVLVFAVPVAGLPDSGGASSSIHPTSRESVHQTSMVDGEPHEGSHHVGPPLTVGTVSLWQVRVFRALSARLAVRASVRQLPDLAPLAPAFQPLGAAPVSHRFPLLI